MLPTGRRRTCCGSTHTTSQRRQYADACQIATFEAYTRSGRTPTATSAACNELPESGERDVTTCRACRCSHPTSSTRMTHKGDTE